MVLSGRISIRGLTVPSTSRVTRGFAGSSLKTVAVFATYPWNPFNLNSNVTFPCPPGGIALSKWAIVQPQLGWTALISRVLVPPFFTMKSWENGAVSESSPKL